MDTPGDMSDGPQLEAIRREIDRPGPGIVFVGLGFPKQDLLIRRLRATMPERCFIGVGINFSFLAGHISRATRWMRRVGLEWLHRLVQEPRRLVRRYLVQGIPFALYLLLSAMRQRFGDRARPGMASARSTDVVVMAWQSDQNTTRLAQALGGRLFQPPSISRSLPARLRYGIQSVQTSLMALRARPRVVIYQDPPFVAGVLLLALRRLLGFSVWANTHSGSFNDPRWTRFARLTAALALEAA